MDGTEFLQLNIIQVGNTICGYSWDTVYAESGSYCKANFSGNNGTTENVWFAEGTTFFANSGGHVLMQLKFAVVKVGKKTFLKGLCRTKPTIFDPGGSPQPFMLSKVSNKPTLITRGMKECLPPKKEVVKPKKQIIPKLLPKATLKPLPEKSDTIIRKSIIVNLPKQQPTTIQKDTLKITAIPIKTNGRINKEQSRIVINDTKIKLEIYDNGTIDGDSVSVYFDNKLVVDKKKLSGNPITLSLDLDENLKLHSLVLFAENLGSIPPNTALIILTTASGKRYELSSSATLEQNSILVFEYKPK